MQADEFRAHGHRLIEWIIDYHSRVESLPVESTVAPGEIAALLPEHPGEPDGFEALFADLDRVVVPGLTNWQHPGFFAWFPANTTYPAILAELVSAGLGVQGMSWATSPAVTEVETRMMDWMIDLLGLPDAFRSTSEAGGGVIQGSASEATLTSILAARWRATEGAVNADSDTTRLVAYATSQAHSSVEKGLRIAGIGTDHLRVVPHDENFAMRPDALADLIAADRAAGLVPFWVCATVGTTNSLAIDPVRAVAEVARAEGVWLHVDAAMAGIATLCPELRWLNDGVELAVRPGHAHWRTGTHIGRKGRRCVEDHLDTSRIADFRHHAALGDEPARTDLDAADHARDRTGHAEPARSVRRASGRRAGASGAGRRLGAQELGA